MHGLRRPPDQGVELGLLQRRNAEASDGRLLLRDLIEHATRPEFVYRHAWREGDLVIWDNRCTMHRGRAFDEREVRDLRRVTTRDISSTLDQTA